jgi:UDP-N-acetylmuramoyl-L-alanyl-D-glutamate--2,6-diaminopimelate ligase
MRLTQLLDEIVVKEVLGNPDIEVSGIVENSNLAGAGSVFAARVGARADGHAHAAEAVRQGAVAVLAQRRCEVDAVQVIVPSVAKVAALWAHRLNNDRARQLTIVGVTGTNGKTTATHMIEAVLIAAGRPTGLIGTLGIRASCGALPRDHASTPTTPPAIELAEILAEMVAAGVSHVVMEASSEALVGLRCAGVGMRVAAFTNLTQDHLNFHKTMENYGRAKGLLFSRLGNQFTILADGGLPVAIVNGDDPWSDTYEQETIYETIRFGLTESAHVRATDVSIGADGVSFRLCTFAGERTVKLAMTGRFNVSNALCAVASCLALRIDLDLIVTALERFGGVPGRFELVDTGQPFAVIVDYAHTPDSLEKVLRTAAEVARGRVIAVVGCGGDRDAAKRPLMAQIACQHAALAILTSDNPRTEDPEKILDDMESGLGEQERARSKRIVQREAGIRAALAAARPGDVVLIAGKGHEPYQIIGTTYYPFDDRAVARRLAGELA